MSPKAYIIYVAILLAGQSVGTPANAQTSLLPVPQQMPDSTPPSVTEADMNRIVDLRTQLRRRNSSYTRPATLNDRLQQLIDDGKEEPVSYLSDEALQLIFPEPVRPFKSWVRFRDTIIVNRLYLPITFRGRAISGKMRLDNKSRTDSLMLAMFPQDAAFDRHIRKYRLEEEALAYIETHHPSLVRYSPRNFQAGKIVLIPINTPVYEEAPIPVVATASIVDTEAPPKFIPDRLYWTSAFESTVQFSQNHVSANWYKGGSSNLNLYTRNYLRYDYKRDKVQWANEAEAKATIYNAPNDTINAYKIGDDLVRIHSNLGYKAFPKWFYSLDLEFKTQFFANYKENTTTKQAAFLAPFSFNMGFGLKYDLEKSFKERGRKLKLNANIAPISFTYMKSIDADIDLGRHGFKKDPETGIFSDNLTRLGSTVRLDMAMSFNRYTTWQSRVYYFTTYEFTQCEFENTLTMALSRFFSTILYFHLRYDDSVTLPADATSYFQLNERISFGFNYKW
ncbi:MAG: DUF3078 domain-containing protein [Tannerellaceae bacterium]|jgi:hypothetical protein|nr:DUF3078 domain-containing protein [Tannerellaceae bacterium]